jgi:hypothetical protein
LLRAASGGSKTIVTVRHTRFIASILIAIAVAATAVTLHAHEGVQIRLRGYYYSEPANVQITVAVEPDANNRTLRVEADGDTMFASSEVALSDDENKRLYTLEFKNLTAGNYTLRAEVLSAKSVVAMAEQELLVAGH